MSSKENEKRPDLNVIVELLDNKGYTNKELAEKTSYHESHISKYVKKFRMAKIVHREEDDKDGDRDIYIGPRENAKPEEKLNAFKYILRSFFEEPRWDATQQLDTTRKLLASKYVDSMIASCGLIPIYEIFEGYMKREEFRSIASQTLLSQPALIAEYTNLPSLMKEHMELNRYGADLLEYVDGTKYLKFLFELNESESIKFHRQHLAKPFGELYRDLTDRDVPRTEDVFVTEGIRKFLELDLFLSPLTSFPINFPVELLFERPFERLYIDFYLSDRQDIKKLIRRAHIVYSNFIDVVSAGVVNSGIYVTDLEALLKQYIFYWNVASQTLDSLYDKMRQLNMFPKDRKSSVYHIYSDATGIQINDLADKKLLLNRDTRNIINHNSLTLWVDDPTKEIRICDCFEEIGLETEKVSYDDVLAGIRSKTENESGDEGDGRLSYGYTGIILKDNKITATFPGGVTLVIEERDPTLPPLTDEEKEAQRKDIIKIENLLDEQERRKHHNS